jgi:hypothetical protein
VDANDVEQVFAGYNWSAEGQAIWQYGCTPGKQPLTPILECVESTSGGGFLAHFGYDNPNSDPVVAPLENAFMPPPANRGQPTVFKPGRVKDAFQVESDGSSLTWTLTGNPGLRLERLEEVCGFDHDRQGLAPERRSGAVQPRDRRCDRGRRGGGGRWRHNRHHRG